MEVVEDEGILFEVIDLWFLFLVDYDFVVVFVCKMGCVVVVYEVLREVGVVVEVIVSIMECCFEYFEFVLLCVMGYDVFYLLVKFEKYYLFDLD